MKILVNDRNEVVCYTQVKDFLYMSKKYDDCDFLNLYVSSIREGNNINSFVRVNDKRLIEMFINEEQIINYMDYKNHDTTTLSRLIVIKSRSNDDYATSDLKALFEFKQNKSGFKLPLISDGTYYYEDYNFSCYKTIIDDCFVIRIKDSKSAIESIGVFSLICNECGYDNVSNSISVSEGCYLVQFNKLKKKDILRKNKKNNA